MTNHIAVSEVEDDSVIFATFDSTNYLFGNLICAHFRLHIIGGNLGRCNENSVFAFILLFYTAVEEEGYMSILLSFSDSELSFAHLSHIFTEGVFESLRLECYMNIGHCSIVLSHAYIVEREEAVLSFEAVECFVNEGSCDFSCSVRTEVEEYNAVVSLDFTVFSKNCGKNEFVSEVFTFSVDCFVALLNGFYAAFSLNAFTVNHSSVSLAYSVPTVVSVHCIISAHYGCNFAKTDFSELFIGFFYVVST